jgi:hypothetical protein
MQNPRYDHENGNQNVGTFYKTNLATKDDNVFVTYNQSYLSNGVSINELKDQYKKAVSQKKMSDSIL